MDEIYTTVEEYESVPTIWFGSELFDMTTVFGFYDDFEVLIEQDSYSTCNLRLEGFV
jgi:hypothetical protein